MEEQDKMDNLFRRLKNHEMRPSEKVWESISIHKESKKRHFWIWYSIPFLILLGGIGLYVRFNPSNLPPTTQTNTQISKHNQPSNSKPSVSNQFQVESIEVKMDGSSQEKEPLSIQTEIAGNTQPFIDIHPAAKKNNSLSELQVPSPSKSKKHSSSTQVQEIVNTQVSEQIVSSPPNQELQSIVQPNEKNEDSMQVESRTTEDQSFKNKNESRNVKGKPKSKPKPEIWMGIDVSGIYSFRNLSTQQAHLAPYVQARNLNEVSLAVAGTQVKMGLSLKNRFILWSGIGYQPFGLSSSFTIENHKQVYVQDTIISRTYVDLNTGLTVNQNDTLSLYKWVKESRESNGNQIFHFIRIPVMLEKNWYLGKISIYSQAGIGFCYTVKAKGTIASYDFTRGISQIPVYDLALRKFNIDFNISSGMVLPLDNRSALKVGAIFTGLSGSVFGPNVPFQQKMFGLGFEAGYRRRI